MKRSFGAAVVTLRGFLAAGVGAFAAGLLAGGCGIPTLVYLSRPAAGAVGPSPAVVTVIHATDNTTESFLGYEMYYKFYHPDVTTFDGDKTAIGAATPTAVIATLTNRGYRRVYAEDLSQPPLIGVPGGAVRLTAFDMLIAFPPNPVDERDAIMTAPAVLPGPLVLLRDLGAEGQKSFRAQMIVLDPPDADMPPGVSPGPEKTISMGLVLLAYGVDFENNTFATLHSEALVIDELLEIYHQ